MDDSVTIFRYVMRFGAAWFAVASAVWLSYRLSPGWTGRCLDRTWRTLASMRYPKLVSATPVLIAGVVTLLAGHGFPQPQFHDEFSYLLAADTFAHGRLANPTPAGWSHFETFHVNLRPYYVSMYQPGQGLVLALGQLLGHPWIGVLLSALAAAWACAWAAGRWLPRRWAGVAGLVASVIVASGYWTNSYWGGAVAACAGALVIGGMARFITGDRPVSRRDALAFATGSVVLMYTRPFEGLALLFPGLVLGILQLRYYVRRWQARSVFTWLGIVLLLGSAGAGWLLYYNRCTTGSPWNTPYTDNRAQYHFRKLFVFESDSATSPDYHHRSMRQMYVDVYQMEPFSRDAWKRSQMPTLVFFGAGLQLLTLLMLPWIVRIKRTRFLVVTTSGVVVAMLLTVWNRPHYFAPALAGFAVLSVQAIRLIAVARGGRRFAAGAVASWLLAAGALGIASLMITATPPPWTQRRTAIAESLIKRGGRHLVLVRYSEGHDPNQGWIYNAADLPGAPVIWARAMNPSSDQELVRLYPDRHAWIVDADDGGFNPYKR